MSNGLRSIEKAGKGSINIWVSQSEGYYSLNIKDTGLGMSERMCSRVFTHVITRDGDNELPGLGICRLGLQHMGGDIICNAIVGEQTHFVIMFPNDA